MLLERPVTGSPEFFFFNELQLRGAAGLTGAAVLPGEGNSLVLTGKTVQD